jgi:hypothetical protein
MWNPFRRTDRSKVQSSSKAQKLYNPSTQFSKPAEVLDDVELSREDKKTALDTASISD